MTSIREELRVSEKLSAEIVGPTLKSATGILASAYSRRMKRAQEVSREHICLWHCLLG